MKGSLLDRHDHLEIDALIKAAKAYASFIVDYAGTRRAH
jgi:hypothetical protein